MSWKQTTYIYMGTPQLSNSAPSPAQDYSGIKYIDVTSYLNIYIPHAYYVHILCPHKKIINHSACSPYCPVEQPLICLHFLILDEVNHRVLPQAPPLHAQVYIYIYIYIYTRTAFVFTYVLCVYIHARQPKSWSGLHVQILESTFEPGRTCAGRHLHKLFFA